MTLKHTPGPWKAVQGHRGAEADTRLIAAAPELLAALLASYTPCPRGRGRAIPQVTDVWFNRYDDCHEKCANCFQDRAVLAVIRKAVGE